MVIQTIKKGSATKPPFAPLVWLDGADSTSMTISTTISQWRDKSGNGYNANEATGGKQPSLTAGALNRRSVVTFGGAQSMKLSAVPLGTFSTFVVFRASANGLVYEQSVNAGTNPGCYMYTDVFYSILVNRNPSNTLSAKDRAANWGIGSTWRVVSQRYNGTNATHLMGINKINQTMTTQVGSDPGAVVVTDDLFLAARNESAAFLTGDIAEIVIYNAFLTDDQAACVNNYLSLKWSV